MKVHIIVTGGVILLAGGCGRTDRPAHEPSPPFSETQTKLAGEATVPLPTADAPLTNQQMDTRDQLVKVAARRHGGFVGLSEIRRQLWISYVSEQWDQISDLKKSQQEKIEIEMVLQKRDNQIDAEYYRELLALAYCATSSEASKLDNEAEASFQKWYDRFPDGFPGMPTIAELEQMDREVETLLARMRVLSELTAEQVPHSRHAI